MLHILDNPYYEVFRGFLHQVKEEYREPGDWTYYQSWTIDRIRSQKSIHDLADKHTIRLNKSTIRLDELTEFLCINLMPMKRNGGLKTKA